jgi:hypothetical protein
MWICGKCSAEINDEFTVCGWCGTNRDGTADPSLTLESIPVTGEVALNTPLETATVVDAPLAAPLAEVLTSSESAPTALLEPPPPPLPTQVPTGPVWEPENKASLSANEYVRVLESKLSSLMDDFDTADWKVNPAFHPEVTAFIHGHADNAAFVKRAQSLQQNRAKYYATMRAQGKKTVAEPPAAAPMAEVPPAAPVAVEDAPVADSFPVFAPPAVEAKTKPTRSRVRRMIVWTIASLCLIVGALLAYVVYGRISGEQQLQEVIASIDESDPRWRWDDLQTDRAEVPDEENAALQVKLVVEELKDWLIDPEVEAFLLSVPPQTRLTDSQRLQLQRVLLPQTRALSEARSLERYKTGRWPTNPDDSRNPSPELRAARDAVSLLHLDCALRAQDRDNDGALASARSMLMITRSIGDDPNVVAQLIRIGYQPRLCATIERILAQGTCSEQHLATTQALLEDEAREPLSWRSLRESRALFQKRLDRLANGDPQAVADRDLFANKTQEDSPFLLADDLLPFECWIRGGDIRACQARVLRLVNEAVETARRPAHEQVDAFPKLEKRADAMLDEEPLLRFSDGAVGFLPMRKTYRAFHRHQTEFLCTIVALGVERYRVATGEWPDSLDQLGRFLPEVPLDPYDGKPLRYRKLADGVVIYSIGPDGEDNAGSVADRKAGSLQGKDIVFRLWNVDNRRRPPAEEVK